jgi:hypothetical protein
MVWENLEYLELTSFVCPSSLLSVLADSPLTTRRVSWLPSPSTISRRSSSLDSPGVAACVQQRRG